MMKMLWDVLTFADFRETGDWLDFGIDLGILMLILGAAGLFVVLVGLIANVIYHFWAYEYEVETYSAKVIRKERESEYVTATYNVFLGIAMPVYNDAGYNVYIETENGLEDAIDDQDLYNSVKKGSDIKVTMKVGRNRKSEKAEYWEVLEYSW